MYSLYKKIHTLTDFPSGHFLLCFLIPLLIFSLQIPTDLFLDVSLAVMTRSECICEITAVCLLILRDSML